jgi:uncharacterized protein YgiM (DUF1202 family)
MRQLIILFSMSSIIFNVASAFAQIPIDSQAQNFTICSFVKGTDVNFRQAPDINSQVMRRLNNGDRVEAIGRNGKWVQVRVQNTQQYPPFLEGYVYDDFLNDCSAGGNPPETKTICSFITGDDVNVREKPNIKAKILTQLDRGYQVEGINRTGDWVKIVIKDSGKIGYVSNEYINGCSEDQFDHWRQ